MIFEVEIRIYRCEPESNTLQLLSTEFKKLSNFSAFEAALYIRKLRYGMIQNNYLITVAFDDYFYAFHKIYAWKANYKFQPFTTNFKDAISWLKKYTDRMHVQV